MEYRQLGRSGIKVSPLCLGMMVFNHKNPEAAVATVSAALDAGINFIDTANVYSRGESEEVTGKAISNRREEVILATKVHGQMTDNGVNDRGNGRRHIIMQCEASLRRLGTDWIDLYQLHRHDPTVPIEETLMALDDLVRSGKVRYVGVSTFPAWRTMQAVAEADHRNLASRPVSEQPPYSILDRRIEREILPLCIDRGVGVLPWSPLQGGLLTGKYNDSAPEGSRLAAFFDSGEQKFVDAREATRSLQVLADDAGTTLTALSLAWLLSRPGVTSPVIGPKNPEQLAENVKALEVTVTDEMSAAIDQIAPPQLTVCPFEA